MDTTILAVMVSVAALGLGVLGLMWRAFDGRMDRLDGRMDSFERQLAADRDKTDRQFREVMDVLRDHGERLVLIEAVLADHTQRFIRIETAMGNYGRRIAHLEGREEALAGT